MSGEREVSHAVQACHEDGEGRWRLVCDCQWEAWGFNTEQAVRAKHAAHVLRPNMGTPERILVADSRHLVSPSLADLECAHGVIGTCLECDLALSDHGKSPLVGGHWQPDYYAEPATLADFECEHLRIGPCPDCDSARVEAPAQLRLSLRP